MRASIRVMLVDDHLIVRQGLRQVLADAEGLSVVADAADGVQAMQLIRQRMGDPMQGLDVVMLDISMPGCASRWSASFDKPV